MPPEAMILGAPPIGHNGPPEPTPFEAIQARITDLYDEAKQWLDGEPITTQAMADAVNKLIVMIREASDEAEALRKAEARPHDDAKAEIQARYNILIGNTKSVKGKTVLAMEVAKKALTPWLEEQDRIKREAERIAREEADAARRAADEAFQKARAESDLAAREEAERLAKEAEAADLAARRAAKDKAHAKGGTGRATTLRSYWIAEITDATEFARYVWANRRWEMDSFLSRLAQQFVDDNHNQTIPGVTVREERKAV